MFHAMNMYVDAYIAAFTFLSNQRLDYISLKLDTSVNHTFRVNGLVTNYWEGGGGSTRREFYLYENVKFSFTSTKGEERGGGIFFSHVEGGGGDQQFWGSFYTVG